MYKCVTGEFIRSMYAILMKCEIHRDTIISAQGLTLVQTVPCQGQTPRQSTDPNGDCFSIFG